MLSNANYLFREKKKFFDMISKKCCYFLLVKWYEVIISLKHYKLCSSTTIEVTFQLPDVAKSLLKFKR